MKLVFNGLFFGSLMAYIIILLEFSKQKSCVIEENVIPVCDHRNFQESIQFSTAENISFEELFQYFRWENRTSCEFSSAFGGIFLGFNGILVQDGQKQVCMDRGVAPIRGNCLVYSFGINNEWSYDEAMEKFGCDVFSFDPSMNTGDHQHSRKIRFFNLGLSGKDVHAQPPQWNLTTLSNIYHTLISVHGERDIDHLKIDIEHSEWDALPDMIRSGIFHKVKQIAMEVHLGMDNEILRDRFQMLRSLERQGFRRFFSQPNPWARVAIPFLNRTESFAYEIAWYNEKFRK